MKKVIVVGSVNMDISLEVDHIPSPGETILSKGSKTSGGGKGANQAAAIGKLGGDVCFIGRVGNDSYGEILKKQLNGYGVNTECLVTDDTEPTGAAYISISKDGENCIIVNPGANYSLLSSQLNDYSHVFDDAAYCVAQLEIPIDTIVDLYRLCKKKNVKFILNPAPATKFPEEVLDGLEYLIPNETEIKMITGGCGDDNLDKQACKLLEMGVKNVLVTLGAEGCSLFNKSGRQDFGAFNVKAVDTTAAGDAFIGGFLTALSEDKDISDAVNFASGVAALAVMKRGAQESLPSRAEVDNFLLNA